MEVFVWYIFVCTQSNTTTGVMSNVNKNFFGYIRNKPVHIDGGISNKKKALTLNSKLKKLRITNFGLGQSLIFFHLPFKA